MRSVRETAATLRAGIHKLRPRTAQPSDRDALSIAPNGRLQSAGRGALGIQPPPRVYRYPSAPSANPWPTFFANHLPLPYEPSVSADSRAAYLSAPQRACASPDHIILMTPARARHACRRARPPAATMLPATRTSVALYPTRHSLPARFRSPTSWTS